MRRNRVVFALVLMVVILAGLAATFWWLTGSSARILVACASALGIAVAAALLAQIGVRVRRRARQLTHLAFSGAASLLDGELGRPSYLPPGDLPPPPAIFMGRQVLFAKMTDGLTARRTKARRPLLVLIHGEAGVGKSGFAVKAASRMAGQFKGGVVYASLTDAEAGDRRQFEVLGVLVDSLQVSTDLEK